MENNMFKRKDLINRMAELDAIPSKAEAGRILDFITNTITTQVTQGNTVAISQKFGTFVPAVQKGKKVIAPNGTQYNTPDKQVIKFKPTAALKAQVAGNAD
jgi:nucleoid DNA-binding protein